MKYIDLVSENYQKTYIVMIVFIYMLKEVSSMNTVVQCPIHQIFNSRNTYMQCETVSSGRIDRLYDNFNFLLC